MVALPTRERLLIVYGQTARAGRNWLNPRPVQLPQVVTQHETFEQDSNEYKLPVAANIPDATTDPSQIRVLPVVDPTAKVKGTGADAANAPAYSGDNSATDRARLDRLQTASRRLQRALPTIRLGQPQEIWPEVRPQHRPSRCLPVKCSRVFPCRSGACAGATSSGRGPVARFNPTARNFHPDRMPVSPRAFDHS